MSNARIRAKKIINDLAIDCPDDLKSLEELCFELGAILNFEPLAGYEGRLVVSPDGGVITINSNERYPARQRFSIGHELGHLMLHSKEQVEFNCSKRDMNEWFGKQAASKREFEANEFSVELLLPEQLMKEKIKNQNPDLEMIKDIANSFEMSLTSTSFRFAELTEEAVAIAIFNKNGVKSFWPSPYFKRQNYWLPLGPLSQESNAFDALSGNGNGRMSMVDVGAWIEVPDHLQEEVIQEQALYFEQIDMGLALIWIKNGNLLRN